MFDDLPFKTTGHIFILLQIINTMAISSKHSEKKDYILSRGMNIMRDRGYNGTSVKDIVSAAGIPKGSFYSYFESKEDFAVKALDKYFKEFIDEVITVLNDTSKSNKERLIAHYENRVKVMLTRPEFKNGCIANSLGDEMGNHSESIRQAIIKKESFVKKKLTEIVQKGQEKGEINNQLAAESLINVIEDAWKGAIITRKEYQNDQSMKNLLLVTKSLLE